MVRDTTVESEITLERSEASGCLSSSEPSLFGVDLRGRDSDGHHWRVVSGFNETIEYHTPSKKAAAFFDELLESLCWNDAVVSEP